MVKETEPFTTYRLIRFTAATTIGGQYIPIKHATSCISGISGGQPDKPIKQFKILIENLTYFL
ncbi:MAG: hypothetical protein MRJ65_02690 [Candidatus Brocadiaceae bacterium]|nr:hypothetical protein [Candidatus Brocadiaceae bacterium]